jgi:hypothetical protein
MLVAMATRLLAGYWPFQPIVHEIARDRAHTLAHVRDIHTGREYCMALHDLSPVCRAGRLIDWDEDTHDMVYEQGDWV